VDPRCRNAGNSSIQGGMLCSMHKVCLLLNIRPPPLRCVDHVFDIGLPPTNSHNIRSTSLQFYIPHAGILHGLAGYFEAVLYGDVGLSIHPHRKDNISKDMLSWFPIFFPFKVGHFYLAFGPLLILKSHSFLHDRNHSIFQAIQSSRSPYGASPIGTRSGTNGMQNLSCPFIASPSRARPPSPPRILPFTGFHLRADPPWQHQAH
jgi:hypothetical protein